MMMEDMHPGLGCYAMDTFHDGQWYTIDATGKINDPGRFINHTSRNNNLILMKSIRIRGHLQIGFVAKYDIKEWEELFYDYGVLDKDIPWLVNDGRQCHMMQPSVTNPAQQKKVHKERVRLNCPIQDCISQERNTAGFVKLSQHTFVSSPPPFSTSKLCAWLKR